jgi:predicted metalloprotease with PDZ domain
MLIKNGDKMKVHYLVQINRPEHHHVKVTLKLTRLSGQNQFKVFLPSWSPGSYLMREYARHIRWFQATQINGEVLFHRQLAKGLWEIDWSGSELKNVQNEFEVSYEIYCKELTVRTSHVDASHAFLHGPSYLMGVFGSPLENPTIEFRFPEAWSKISTSLKDISSAREVFQFQAKNYDELIDSPVEIGCHETDGFEYQGKPHHMATYGGSYPHSQPLKEDFKKIVSTVAAHFNHEIPYESYLFINHFLPRIYGGLEHLNSTALHFDGRKLANRKDYLNYLSLVAHEYFHLWNVKRIRPKELGPFDYLNEGYSTMLWLAEGLTSFMDDLLVYRSGLSTLEEYLEAVKGHLDIYFSTPGRKYHSLEQSSFNAWVKLYRPDENSKNSSISYYLKGGLVFMALHSLLLKKGKSVDHLLTLLWSDFKSRPERGLGRDDFYKLVETLGGSDVLESFSNMIETTQEIDFDSVMKSFGLELKWTTPTNPWLGVEWEFSGERVLIKSVALDSSAHKSGLNSGDEVLFINGFRFLREDADKLSSYLLLDKSYEFVVSRLGRSTSVRVIPEMGPRQLKEIVILDKSLAEKSFRLQSN